MICSIIYIPGIDSEQPILQPLTVRVCPNDTVTYTCRDTNVTEIDWYVTPYRQPIVSFSPVSVDLYNLSNIDENDDRFFFQIPHIVINGENNEVADYLTMTFTVNITGSNNGTIITCKTFHHMEESRTSSFLYFAGIIIMYVRETVIVQSYTDEPHWRAPSITYRENETYFTAVLELGDMFDGGGVPIDHYNIQMGNGTQLEIPDPTHSFDIMYNTTLSVNISAHNCAGYSDPFPLDIEYYREGLLLYL